MNRFIKFCLLLLIVGGSVYWFINKDIISLKEIDKEMAVSMSKKMIAVEKKYHYPRNEVYNIEGTYIVDINDTGNSSQISYMMGNGTTEINNISLTATMKIDGGAFDLDEYPALKEALTIIYGGKSSLPKKLEKKVEEGTKISMLEKYKGELIREEGDLFVLTVVPDSQDTNGYNLNVICMRNYGE